MIIYREQYDNKKPNDRRDWEIISYNHIRTGGISKISSMHDNDPVEIHSIKRLSDREIFSIGDDVCLNWYPAFSVKQPIGRFEIVGNKMIIHYQNEKNGHGQYELKYAMISPNQKSYTHSSRQYPDNKELYEEYIVKQNNIINSLKEQVAVQRAMLALTDKKYTEEDLINAFNAGRERDMDNPLLTTFQGKHSAIKELTLYADKYPTPESYLQSIIKKQ